MLEGINSPQDLKKLSIAELKDLSGEIRREIIRVVSENGGHLAASLGAVEIAIALHYLLDSPRDKIVWDVGHQAYAHKLLTGRRDKFHTLRQGGGISGFPNKDESEHDQFTVGHGSTSISTALGLVAAREISNDNYKVVAIIGDGSLAGGMALEALNHAGHFNKNLIVILNDNEMSISPSVGAFSRYLNRVTSSPIYNRIRTDVESVLKKVPRFGFRAYRAARKLEEGLKNLLVPGIIFEELGFRYFGPIDGHDLNTLTTTIGNVMNLKEPVLIHCVTKKGKGYKPAEDLPGKFHGIVPFEIENGRARKKTTGPETFTQAFGRKIIKLAEHDQKIVAITAAMPDGTGLDEFARVFPERFFNTGMTEQHAIGFAAGLAKAGYKPVVAIYSTFLQRSYDQIVHDVLLQDLPVVMMLDRAGLVGEDGATHHGVLDIAYLRPMPKMVLMAPSDTAELEMMLEFAVNLGQAAAIRYPKGSLPLIGQHEALELGKSQALKQGNDNWIIALGSMVPVALEASKELAQKGIEVGVVNARFVKPLDEKLIKFIGQRAKKILIIEEGVKQGGFGSAVLEFLEEEGLGAPKIKCLGLPDKFIEHDQREILLDKYGLNKEGIKSWFA